MELTLIVPGLLLPEAVRRDTLHDLRIDSLSRLLSRARQSPAPLDPIAAAFGLPPPLPVAALRKVGAGETADQQYLCLDPVHWVVGRESIRLADPADLNITTHEAEAIMAALAPLLADWGDLTADAPDRWTLALSKPADLHLQALPDAIERPIDPHLPGGNDGRAWRRLLAELQILLHAHPVNQARSAAGQPSIDSLWPWGLGSVPPLPSPSFDIVWSDDPSVAGLARLAGLPCLPVQTTFHETGHDILCINSALPAAAHRLDALGWRAALTRFSTDWIEPIWQALGQGQLRTLTLIATEVPPVTRSIAFRLTRPHRYALWRRPRPLADLL